MKAFASSPHKVLALFSLVLFPFYGWFYANTGRAWSSPDERTVFVFASQWADEGSFLLPRPISDDVLLPRSVTVVGDHYAPVGFLGLFLILGTAMKLLGKTAALFVVPALAAGTPIVLFSLWRRWFSERTSFVAALLWGVFPAWAYYASRGLLPNVAFVSLLIYSLAAALYAREVKIRRQATMAWVLCGLLAGLALIIRPVEVLWVLPIALTLWLWSAKPVRAGLAALSAVLPIAWLAFWQSQTYGAWYKVGYSPFGLESTTQTGLFPFGIHPLLALQHVADYSFWVYGWALVFWLAGGFYLYKNHSKNAAYKKYSLVFAFVSIYLVLYYGSWNISDHPNQDWISLGVAYNRYWLPIFALSMPLLAEGLRVVSARIRFVSMPIAAALVLGASVATSFFLGDDSLWAMQQHGVEYKQVQAFIETKTEPDSVIVAGREEKFLWPQRSVLYTSDNTFTFAQDVQPLLSARAVYWLTPLPQSHVADVEQRLFAPQNQSLQLVGKHGEYTLYLIRS